MLFSERRKIVYENKGKLNLCAHAVFILDNKKLSKNFRISNEAFDRAATARVKKAGENR